jgi:hypothetical protein
MLPLRHDSVICLREYALSVYGVIEQRVEPALESSVAEIDYFQSTYLNVSVYQVFVK